MSSVFRRFYHRHKKYLPVLFFIGGFIWDSLTLGRIDKLYSNFLLLGYLLLLTISLYVFNLADDGKWEDTFLGQYTEFSPLAVQFLLGGLSSAYVIFYFRSVSFTKTMVFFLLLVVLFISNEFLKHRISNKYLQFGAYFFVNFTFFTFFIPVVFGVMSTVTFMIAGIIALVLTLIFVSYIYYKSPSTRREVSLKKMSSLIIGLYLLINGFYYFNLIPPVPLSLQTGLIAYDVNEVENVYQVTYNRDDFYKFWKTFDTDVAYARGDTIFAFTSIFAPTSLKEDVYHRWKWRNPQTGDWIITDKIGYEITGGRGKGYRGYTFKTHLRPGKWEIDVITSEGMILGTINFQLHKDSTLSSDALVHEKF